MLGRTLERVLVVEDQPDIAAIVRLALETLGRFTVKVCVSGDEALREAVAFAPDIVLLDVMMPVLDGPATLAALRRQAELAHVPVVFVTARVLPEEVERYRALGAVGVIAKPFQPMRLAEQVRELWATAQADLDPR